MKKYILLNVIMVFLLCIFVVFTENALAATNGEGYCQVPPYVIQNTPPSIMIVVDNSGSMFNFAYYDGFFTNTSTNDCTASGSPCTGFIFDFDKDSDIDASDTYPFYKYYGYFNPDYWYTYSSTSGGRFVPTDPKTGSNLSGERAKTSSEWDGNFLNWLTMRRMDIIKKVLTGGKVVSTGGGFGRLEAVEADGISRGAYKMLNLSGYVPTTVASGSVQCIQFATGGSSPSDFSVKANSNCGSATVGTYTVQVEAPTPVEGILQSLVGTKARLGLTFYKANSSGYSSTSDQGGFVQVPVGGSSLSAMVNQINLAVPSTNTPLGETLWTVIGYYAQQTSMEGGPGPRYANGDYTINTKLNDPFNYGTSGQPRYPTCGKGYVLYITDGEPCADGKLPSTLLNYAQTQGSKFNCGSPNAVDSCPAVSGISPETFSFPAKTFVTCSAGSYVAGIEDVALYAHTKDLRTDIAGTQNLTIFPVFAFGKGSTLLRYTAINGGFKDSNGDNLPDTQIEWDKNGDGEPDNFYEANDGYELEQGLKNAFSTMLERVSSGTAASVLASGGGSGANLLQAVFYPRRRVGNDIISWTGSMQNLWYYMNPFNIRQSSIREETPPKNNILNTMSDYILSLYFDYPSQETKGARCRDVNGDGTCDNMQLTLPFESVGNLWETGSLLWSRDLSVSPQRRIYTQKDGINLIEFSEGNATTLMPYLDLPTSGDTNMDGFIDGDLDHDADVDDNDAKAIIKYVLGDDTVLDSLGNIIPGYRSRTVTLGSDTHVWKLGDIINSTPKISSWIPTNSYHWAYNDATYGPSTSQIDLTNPPSSAHFITMDTQSNIVDGTPIGTGTIDGYRKRGMAFIGGNDGMLHAFTLGTLQYHWSPQTHFDKARLVGSNLGEELWAFIPKNALPYLKYMMDPEYCHVYTVDLTPVIVDVSINIDTDIDNDGTPDQPAECTPAEYWNCVKTPESWRTILIGGMRTGGACRGKATTCTDVDGDGQKDCVNAPLTVTENSTNVDIGFSSYFALDITDHANPRFLWEFTDPQLGFTTSGPALVKIGAREISGTGSNVDTTKNGREFVIFASGPTGPVSVGDNQFLGRSDQPLSLFVLDLKTGALVKKMTMNGTNGMPNIPNAFASSIFSSGQDFVQKHDDYQDDAVYIGYTQKCTSTNGICTNNTWTNGGVLRLFTKKSLNGTDLSVTGNTAINPNNWGVSKVIENVGPVTAGVKRIQKVLDTNTNGGIAWLYFGTGRYFYSQAGTVDDPDTTRAIFGIKEPCFSNSGLNENCTSTVAFCTTPCSNPTGSPTCSAPASCGDLVNVFDENQTVVSDPEDSGYHGWYINLHPVGNYTHAEGTNNVARNYKTERSLTDPTVTSRGCVEFVTSQPYADECDIGGKSFLRTVWYETGAKVPEGIECGIVILQLSTGSIENVPADAWISSALEGMSSGPSGATVVSPGPRQRIFQSTGR